MKIARPSKPEGPFKRTRSPPPQATKLLRYSFLYGVVFMVGQALSAMALVIVLLARLRGEEPFAEAVRPQVVHDLGNAPFVFRWPASKALFIDRANKIKEAAMGRVESSQCSLQSSLVPRGKVAQTLVPDEAIRTKSKTCALSHKVVRDHAVDFDWLTHKRSWREPRL